MREVGTPKESRKWLEAACQLATKHLKSVCVEPTGDGTGSVVAGGCFWASNRSSFCFGRRDAWHDVKSFGAQQGCCEAGIGGSADGTGAVFTNPLRHASPHTQMLFCRLSFRLA